MLLAIACSICGKGFVKGERVFGRGCVWLPESVPLCGLCDGAMHADCYGEWPHRERFAASYFKCWVENERRDVHWHRAYFDDEVLVTVNPFPPIESTWVHLRATGDRISVKVEEWQEWLAKEVPETLHKNLREPLVKAKAALQATCPTAEALLADIDWEFKRPVVEAANERYRRERAESRARQREIQPHNRRCNELMREAELHGLTCTHCKVHSKEYRLSRAKGQKSLVICLKCGYPCEVKVIPET